MSAATMNTTLLADEVDLVADVILWEMCRQGDMDDYVDMARDVARAILLAQRRGAYLHHICRGPAPVAAVLDANQEGRER